MTLFVSGCSAWPSEILPYDIFPDSYRNWSCNGCNGLTLALRRNKVLLWDAEEAQIEKIKEDLTEYFPFGGLFPGYANEIAIRKGRIRTIRVELDEHCR